jgi:N-acyl-D-amino-acid deacylase
LYVSHIRDEAVGGADAISEALNIGKRAGLPVQISHFKASGQGQWGSAQQRLDLVRRAIAQGQQVTIDQYPYDFSSTTLDLLLPKDLAENAELRRATHDAKGRRQVVQAILEQAQSNGWHDFSFAQFGWYGRDHRLDGMNIPEICKFLSKPCPTAEEQAAVVLDLRLRGGGGQMLYHDMNSADVETIFLYPDTMVGTDSRIRTPDEQGHPHPRGYSTFPRILGQYVREKQLISLPEAVRRMTSLAAKTFHLGDRGTIRPGAWADLVVFDPKTIRDADDPAYPDASPTGILDVYVNGVPVFLDGEETLKSPGQALLRAQTAGSPPVGVSGKTQR